MAMGNNQKEYIIMKKILIINILLLFTNCNAQSDNTKQYTVKKNKKIMTLIESITLNELTKKFDFETFNKNKDKQGIDDTYVFELKDSTIVSQTNDLEVPIEERKKENFPISQSNIYFKKGSIRKTSLSFNNSFFGISKEFNKNGELIKETDHDIEFKLGFEDVREIVNKTKDIDLYDTRQAMALRHLGHKGTRLPLPYYQIHVFKTLPNGILKPNYSFLIDAKTGKEFNPKENQENKKEQNKKGFWNNLLGN